MLAKEVLTEEWLADVLQDSLDADWTSTDGARAIMRALEDGLVELPQRGGQIAAPPVEGLTSGEGWKLVPVEPTEAMIEAFCEAHCDFFGGPGWWKTGLLADTLPKAREAAVVAFRAALAATPKATATASVGEDWRDDTDNAPYDTPVRVRVGDMTFIAKLMPDAGMREDETSCDQWVAVNEGEHPPCWSGGACWDSNEDGDRSLQPCAWVALTDSGTAATHAGSVEVEA